MGHLPRPASSCRDDVNSLDWKCQLEELLFLMDWPQLATHAKPRHVESFYQFHHQCTMNTPPYSVGSRYRTSSTNCDDPIHGSGPGEIVFRHMSVVQQQKVWRETKCSPPVGGSASRRSRERHEDACTGLRRRYLGLLVAVKCEFCVK